MSSGIKNKENDMAFTNNKGFLEFEGGDIITSKENKYYIIDSYIDSGKDGAVYSAFEKNNKIQKYAIKMFYKASSFSNAKRLHKHTIISSTTFPEFALPIDLFTYQSTNIQVNGIIANFVGEKTLGSLMGKPKKKGSLLTANFISKCKMLKNICIPIERLNKVGWAYSDISLNNIRIDGMADKVYLIDCDGIRPHDKVVEKVGTTFFMAPEVAFGKTVSGIHVDRYAIAQLIFRSLLGEFYSPYAGKLTYKEQINVDHMFELSGSVNHNDALRLLKFIFDPIDKTNSLIGSDPPGQIPSKVKEKKEQIDRVISTWESIPNEIQELFIKAFKNPFDKSSQENRPTISQWIRIFDKVIDGSIKFGVQAKNRTGNSNQQPKPLLDGSLHLQINQNTGGVITTEPNKDNFKKGEYVRIIASPNTGYEFSKWTIKGSTMSKTTLASNLIQVMANTILSAIFVKSTNKNSDGFSLIIRQSNGGFISVEPKKDKYSVKDLLVISAKPNTGYSFVEWRITGGTVPNKSKPFSVLTLKTDATLSVIFKLTEKYEKS